MAVEGSRDLPLYLLSRPVMRLQQLFCNLVHACVGVFRTTSPNASSVFSSSISRGSPCDRHWSIHICYNKNHVHNTFAAASSLRICFMKNLRCKDVFTLRHLCLHAISPPRTYQYPLEAFPLPPNISILYIRVLRYGEVSLCSVCAEKN